MAKTYHESAPAKINLSLRVTGRDSKSGYHLLDMVNARISLIDKLKVSIAQTSGESIKDNLLLSGQYTQGADGKKLSDNNIVWKTVESFRSKFNVKDSILIELDKQIPVGAGLGGGSSDAASTLKILCKHYFNGVIDSEIYKLALTLGADVPYFLADCSWQRVEGFGEKLTELDSTHPAYQLRDKLIALILPPFGVVTKNSFQKFKELNLPFYTDVSSSESWQLGANDLLQSSFAAQDLLKPFYESVCKVVADLNVYMSGSGSCLYSVDFETGQIPMLIHEVQKLGGKVLMVGFL